MPALPFLALTAFAGQAAADDGASLQQQCLASAFPASRSDFPALLNCLGLHGDAVEVGVQAGVHASGFLQGWQGRRLRLVDTWGLQGEASGGQLFYIDIANVHGVDIRRQHRAHCEARLAEELRGGRAEIVNLDSAVAASGVRDGELDFVYLDARHDFAGVAADIHAWWPKVRVGGVFAGHDFVDGEFPEGDFFWISALSRVLPGLEGATHVTREKNRYPSFFVLKTREVAGIVPQGIQAEMTARKLYAERSKYFKLWQDASGTRGFGTSCGMVCGRDCAERAQRFTPTRTVGSTLRPFACGGQAKGPEAGPQHEGPDAPAQASASPDVCAAEMVMDVQAYLEVCVERCNVTCQQRVELFSTFGAEILSV